MGEGLVYIVLGILYIAPALIAEHRGHKQAYPIAIVNIFLGRTVIGWVIVLVRACRNNDIYEHEEPKRNNRTRKKR